MRALRMRYDRITVLTTAAQAAVISPLAADEIWHDDDTFWSLVQRLRTVHFDAAVVTWATARTACALALAGIPQRIGQAGRIYSPLFTKSVALASERGDHKTRWVQLLLEYARVLGCDGDETPISIVDDTARSAATTLLSSLALGDTKFAVLHATRGISQDRYTWPASALARVAMALRERYGIPVLLTGSEAERDVIAGIAHRSGGINIAGMTSLPVFAAVTERANFVVAMDSGPMHLAAATGTPTVGIFAMRPDEPDRWHPVGPRTAVVRSVFPCPAQHTKERCPDFACVRDLDSARVVATLDGLLGTEHEQQL